MTMQLGDYERDHLKPGDWLQCTLPRLTALYGRLCQVVSVPTPDKGVRVAFPPTRPGWKPYRTALDDRHWTAPDDAVTLLGLVAR